MRHRVLCFLAATSLASLSFAQEGLSSAMGGPGKSFRQAGRIVLSVSYLRTNNKEVVNLIPTGDGDEAIRFRQPKLGQYIVDDSLAAALKQAGQFKETEVISLLPGESADLWKVAGRKPQVRGATNEAQRVPIGSEVSLMPLLRQGENVKPAVVMTVQYAREPGSGPPGSEDPNASADGFGFDGSYNGEYGGDFGSMGPPMPINTIRLPVLVSSNLTFVQFEADDGFVSLATVTVRESMLGSGGSLDSPAPDKQVSLYPLESLVVDMGQPVTGVTASDSSVAWGMARRNTVTLLGSQPGASVISINLEDGSRPQILVNVSLDIRPLELLIGRLYPDASIHILPVRQSLLIRGKVNSIEQSQQIEEIALEFGPRVLNHLQVASKGRTGARDMGVPPSTRVGIPEPPHIERDPATGLPPVKVTPGPMSPETHSPAGSGIEALTPTRKANPLAKPGANDAEQLRDDVRALREDVRRLIEILEQREKAKADRADFR